MCGRFVRKSTITVIEDEFDIYEIQWASEPSYNIVPGQDIACVVKNGGNRLIACRWGFIPFWAEDESIGYKMINARAETLAEKRSFSRAFRQHRCLIVADGFYEWKKLEDKKFKIPYYFHLRSGGPFGFAGLYGTWKSKDGKVVTTCTIVTTKPNKLMMPIHNRMPAIIGREQRDVWLDKDEHNPDILLPLLAPYSPEEMAAYEVSRLVNSPKYNEPDCIKPVTSFKQDSLI